jgi:uncharacterized SAM-binding protein YcdF (DUF218 family)
VFWLKKLVSFWLMPLPLCLALIVLGLLLSRRRSRLGRGMFATGAVLLILFSNKAVSNRLLRPLEDRYPAIPEIAARAPAPNSISGCRFVVVLGGGHSAMVGKPATSQLSSSALGRIVEAVRLLRVLPKARLVVSGPGEPGQPSHAAVLSEAARSLGVDPARVILVETAHDTEEEAAAISRLVGRDQIALVTSAWHMPRAAYLFARAGVDTVPCPADFVSREAPGARGLAFSWDSESLERSTRAVHEWLGLLWLRLRG